MAAGSRPVLHSFGKRRCRLQHAGNCWVSGAAYHATVIPGIAIAVSGTYSMVRGLLFQEDLSQMVKLVSVLILGNTVL